MNIAASQILPYIPDETYQFSVYTASQAPFRQVSREELLILIEEGRVRASIRGSRIHRIYLTVPPDVAGRDLGESRKRVKDAFHTDANVTVLGDRSRKRHHREHCFQWGNKRHPIVEVPGFLRGDSTGLIPSERLTTGVGPMTPPLRIEGK